MYVQLVYKNISNKDISGISLKLSSYIHQGLSFSYRENFIEVICKENISDVIKKYMKSKGYENE